MPTFNIRGQRDSVARTPRRNVPCRRPSEVSAVNRTKRSESTDTSARAEEQQKTPTGVIRDGFILDFISGTREIKETAKEQHNSGPRFTLCAISAQLEDQ